MNMPNRASCHHFIRFACVRLTACSYSALDMVTDHPPSFFVPTRSLPDLYYTGPAEAMRDRTCASFVYGLSPQPDFAPGRRGSRPSLFWGGSGATPTTTRMDHGRRPWILFVVKSTS